MAETVLVLRLEGPLQSWGTRSRWDVRDTGNEPTKSGVVGLIGCAKGLSRDDPGMERLDRLLLFGVRIDRPGVVSTDYQTVTGYHRTAANEFKHSAGTARSLEKAQEHGESTIVSPRDYLHDAAFLVVLAVKPEYQQHEPGLLGQLHECLEHPRWPLYLGRKSCVPTRPVFDRLTDEYPDLLSALRGEPWGGPQTPDAFAFRERAGKNASLEAWLERPNGTYERQDAMRLNQLRLYEFRRCERIEIDAESLPRRAS